MAPHRLGTRTTERRLPSMSKFHGGRSHRPVAEAIWISLTAFRQRATPGPKRGRASAVQTPYPAVSSGVLFLAEARSGGCVGRHSLVLSRHRALPSFTDSLSSKQTRACVDSTKKRLYLCGGQAGSSWRTGEPGTPSEGLPRGRPLRLHN